MAASPAGHRLSHSPAPLDENVREIKRWEEATRHARSKAEQLSDWIAARAASGPGLVVHVICTDLHQLTSRMAEFDDAESHESRKDS